MSMRNSWSMSLPGQRKTMLGFLSGNFLAKNNDDDDKFALMDWFDLPEFFTTAQLSTYGKSRTIEYKCVDLLWRPIDAFVRFVCIKDGDGKYVLMYSDLNLSPIDIITIFFISQQN